MSVSDDVVVAAVAKIVAAHTKTVPAHGADELIELIRLVGEALVSGISGGWQDPPQKDMEPSAPPRRVLSADDVVALDGRAVRCLECGVLGARLRRHIERAHGMMVREYKMKWGQHIPLIAPAYSKKKSAQMKAIRSSGRRRSDDKEGPTDV